MILIVTLNPCIDKTIFVKKNKLGKINLSNRIKIIAGGKGNNVARVLKNLGIKNLTLNFLGGYTGKIIQESLEEEKLCCEPVWIKNPSRTVVTILENNLRQTAYVEPGPEISNEEKLKFLNKFDEICERYLSNIKMIVLSGSVPCAICNDIYKELIIKSKSKNIKVLLDSRGIALNEGVKAIPYLIKPNLDEFKDVAGYKIGKLDLLNSKKMKKHLREAGNSVEVVVLTMGSKGSYILFRENLYRVSQPKVKVLNPVGSGDSFLAGFAYGMYKGMDIIESARIGTAAGIANAVIWDAASCSKNQIFEFIKYIKIKEI